MYPWRRFTGFPGRSWVEGMPGALRPILYFPHGYSSFFLVTFSSCSSSKSGQRSEPTSTAWGRAGFGASAGLQPWIGCHHRIASTRSAPDQQGQYAEYTNGACGAAYHPPYHCTTNPYHPPISPYHRTTTQGIRTARAGRNGAENRIGTDCMRDSPRTSDELD